MKWKYKVPWKHSQKVLYLKKGTFHCCPNRWTACCSPLLTGHQPNREFCSMKPLYVHSNDVLQSGIMDWSLISWMLFTGQTDRQTESLRKSEWFGPVQGLQHRTNFSGLCLRHRPKAGLRSANWRQFSNQIRPKNSQSRPNLADISGPELALCWCQNTAKSPPGSSCKLWDK